MTLRVARSKLLLLAPMAFLLGGLLWFMLCPPSGTAVTKVVFIKRGMPLKKIAHLLKQEGIIRNEEFFMALTTLLGRKAGIKAGEYELTTRMSPLQLSYTLVKGYVKRHLVTIPEGYTVNQIAHLLQDLHIVEEQAFLEKASSPAMVRAVGLSLSSQNEHAPTLEGYLFPDTYHFVRGMDVEQVIRIMVSRFKNVFVPDLAEKALRLKLSEKDAVILASIIEKETCLGEEKPLISAVFHNRLKKNMPLQSDPTVIYGIKDFDGNLKKEHLMKYTPYNTYLFPGLPPTPICNPGRDSLIAAVSPAPVPYLYFVSKNNGSHHFSGTIEEHNRAVLKYQSKNSLTRK